MRARAPTYRLRWFQIRWCSRVIGQSCEKKRKKDGIMEKWKDGIMG